MSGKVQVDKLISELDDILSKLSNAESKVKDSLSKLEELVKEGCSSKSNEEHAKVAEEIESLVESVDPSELLEEAAKKLCSLKELEPELEPLKKEVEELTSKLQELKTKLMACTEVREDNAVSCYETAREVEELAKKVTQASEVVQKYSSLVSKAEEVLNKYNTVKSDVEKLKTEGEKAAKGFKSRVSVRLVYSEGGNITVKLTLADVDAEEYASDELLACIPGARIGAAKEVLKKHPVLYWVGDESASSPIDVCGECGKPKSIYELLDCASACFKTLAILKLLSDEPVSTKYDYLLSPLLAKPPEFIVLGGDGWKVYGEVVDRLDELLRNVEVKKLGEASTKGEGYVELEEGYLKLHIDYPLSLPPVSDKIVTSYSVKVQNLNYLVNMANVDVSTITEQLKDVLRVEASGDTVVVTLGFDPSVKSVEDCIVLATVDEETVRDAVEVSRKFWSKLEKLLKDAGVDPKKLAEEVTTVKVERRVKKEATSKTQQQQQTSQGTGNIISQVQQPQTGATGTTTTSNILVIQSESRTATTTTTPTTPQRRQNIITW